jgi:hypothetical protein
VPWSWSMRGCTWHCRGMRSSRRTCHVDSPARGGANTVAAARENAGVSSSCRGHVASVLGGEAGRYPPPKKCRARRRSRRGSCR